MVSAYSFLSESVPTLTPAVAVCPTQLAYLLVPHLGVINREETHSKGASRALAA